MPERIPRVSDFPAGNTRRIAGESVCGVNDSGPTPGVPA